MAAGTGSKETELENEWYIRGFVLTSLVLQVLLYFLPPLRRRSRSKWLLCVISMVFALSTWIPTFTLLLICSCAILGHENNSDYKPPLLMWAALMLVHNAGHGQERQAPYNYSLEMSDYGKEFSQTVLKFVLCDIPLFCIVFLFQYGREIPNLAPLYVLLACLRTFSKLKHLSEQSKELKGLNKSRPEVSFEEGETMFNGPDETAAHFLLGFQKLIWKPNLSHASQNFFRRLGGRQAIRVVEVELNLIYNKSYRAVLPSTFELAAVVTVLPVLEPYSTTALTLKSYIFLVVHLIVLFYTLSNPMLNLPVLISWYAHKYQTENGLDKLDVDDHIIHIAALICTHQLVVRLWFMKQGSQAQLVYDHDDNNRETQSQTQRGTVQRFNLHRPWKVHDLMDHYLGQPLLSQSNNNRLQGWSRTIPRFNLLVYGLRKPTKVSAFVHCLLNAFPVSTKERYTDDLGEFIFNELQLTRPSEICYYNGQSALLHDYEDLVDNEAPFEEIMLRWHLATGIMYHTCNTETNTSTSSSSDKDRSMVLSDYMVYLLMVQPLIMSKQRGDVFRRSLDALSEFSELIDQSSGDDQSHAQEKQQLREICLQMQRLHNSKEKQQPPPPPRKRKHIYTTVWAVKDKVSYSDQEESSTYHQLLKEKEKTKPVVLLEGEEREPADSDQEESSTYYQSLKEKDLLEGGEREPESYQEQVFKEEKQKTKSMFWEEETSVEQGFSRTEHYYLSLDKEQPGQSSQETNKSLVDDACDLAGNIKSRIPDTEKMWEMISKVWAAMLAYAVIKTDPMDHIRGLSQGGELATIVWLYTLHLGYIREDQYVKDQ